jgi:Uma2 family endonuclease
MVQEACRVTLVEGPPAEERFLTWTDWEGYLHILEAFKDRRIKITYDRGTLELLSPSRLHETVKGLLGLLLAMAFLERRIPFRSAGSTTFRRRLLDRGLEPDDCYFLSQVPPA